VGRKACSFRPVIHTNKGSALVYVEARRKEFLYYYVTSVGGGSGRPAAQGSQQHGPIRLQGISDVT
jgi:hypothetical protein